MVTGGRRDRARWLVAGSALVDDSQAEEVSDDLGASNEILFD